MIEGVATNVNYYDATCEINGQVVWFGREMMRACSNKEILEGNTIRVWLTSSGAVVEIALIQYSPVEVDTLF